MINMEHCRFSNTLIALKECQNAMSEELDIRYSSTPEKVKELSKEEFKARRELIDLCDEIYSQFKGELGW